MLKVGQASILSAREWSKLESVAKREDHRLIWLILRFTASRIGEVLQLKVGDVYKLDGYPLESIQFRRETRKGKDKKQTVPICPQLRVGLVRISKGSPDRWLFPSPRDPLSHLSYEAVLRYLQRTAELAGLGDKKITTHSGRRSCITSLARQGTDLKTIQAITGHKTIQNLSLYIDSDPERSRNALSGIFQ